MTFIYKIASTEQEMDDIFRLNYRTFVEEIPQHPPRAERKLVDKFHAENTYLICKDGEKLAGMLAVRDRRPFSMDGKIPGFERYLPWRPQRMVEIRLLAVDPAYRGSRLLGGLIRYLDRYLKRHDYDMGIISGTTRELKLYSHLGFVPFAEPVGTEEAAFQPMYITGSSFERSGAYRVIAQSARFLAGPVEIAEEVTRALAQRPLSHRSPEFARLLEEVRARLCKRSGARNVNLLLGSGTLANDAVAGQLKRLGGRGLILVNGEFGRRLTVHARRWQLAFDTIESEYGLPLDACRAEAAAASGRYRWIWAVHGETSTGVLNDLERLKGIAAGHGLALAMDCVSSFGAVPFSLEGVALASGVSGKAISSYTGLSFVFHQGELTPDESIPPYIDAGAYAAADGVPYSQSSNLLNALAAALRAYDTPEPYETVQRRYLAVREGVERIGLQVLAHRFCAAPYIATVVLPESISSRELGDRMADQGFELQYESGYLLARNWIQIATLGLQKDKDIRRMLDTLEWFVHHSSEYASSGASAMNGLALPTT